MIAYNGQDGLRIDRVQSDYVVPLLKQEIEDVRSLAEKLHKAVEIVDFPQYGKNSAILVEAYLN